MKNNVLILDSTLRDGGYCNKWEFGKENIRQIVEGLEETNIDIIECGILCDGKYSEDCTKYQDENEIEKVIFPKKGQMYVALMNFGGFEISRLKERTKDGIDGIRLAFHKKDMREAMKWAKIIKAKGYELFLQPMVTSSYTKAEYLRLIGETNEVKPYAFYIVDSFGSMKGTELDTYLEIIEQELCDGIILGFHSHNNLQLAFSNSQHFVGREGEKQIIVDCCIMGMGRGAGNLNTELFIEYMNEQYEKKYTVEPILKIIDEILNVFYRKKYWGYSLPNYLSATHNLHPNYATYLAEKNTMSVSMINKLLQKISVEKKCGYDEKYIEELYIEFMDSVGTENKSVKQVEIFRGKDVLLIAPGKSIDDEKASIQQFISKHKVEIISVNFNYSEVKGNFVFVSNSRRYEDMTFEKVNNYIITSNIDTEIDGIRIDYKSLLCKDKYIRDNAAIMLLELLKSSGVNKVYLAGVDGYSHDIVDNYSKESSALVTSDEMLDKMNESMSKKICELSKEIDIEFITREKNVRIMHG